MIIVRITDEYFSSAGYLSENSIHWDVVVSGGIYHITLLYGQWWRKTLPTSVFNNWSHTPCVRQRRQCTIFLYLNFVASTQCHDIHGPWLLAVSPSYQRQAVRILLLSFVLFLIQLTHTRCSQKIIIIKYMPSHISTEYISLAFEYSLQMFSLLFQFWLVCLKCTRNYCRQIFF